MDLPEEKRESGSWGEWRKKPLCISWFALPCFREKIRVTVLSQKLREKDSKK